MTQAIISRLGICVGYKDHCSNVYSHTVLQAFQSVIYLKINGMSDAPQKRKSVIQKQERTKKCTSLYETDKCTRLDVISRPIIYMNMPIKN